MAQILQDKAILIGGITGGLGSTVAAQAVEAGANIAGFSRHAPFTDSSLSHHAGIFHQTADARQEAGVTSAVDASIEKFGRIDGYVHAIGSIFLKPAHRTKVEEFEEVMRQNLVSAFIALKCVVPALQKQGGGSVVFVSSTASKIGLPNHESIAAAKAGINGLVVAAAATYASRRVRINAVAPGLVDTPMAAPLLATDQARAISEKMHPLGRIGQPADIASLILWLLSDQASWTTGQVFPVDGGMSSVLPRPRA